MVLRRSSTQWINAIEACTSENRIRNAMRFTWKKKKEQKKTTSKLQSPEKSTKEKSIIIFVERQFPFLHNIQVSLEYTEQSNWHYQFSLHDDETETCHYSSCKFYNAAAAAAAALMAVVCISFVKQWKKSERNREKSERTITERSWLSRKCKLNNQSLNGGSHGIESSIRD